MIEETIKPETELEKRIIADTEFIEGAMWGKARTGHPEGQVVLHIGSVLKNVDKYSTPKNREKLRLIAIIHDTFKYKVDQTKPKSGENHHAMLARRFAERYITDKQVLEIIELHDEGYNSWCKGDRDNKWDKAEERAKKVLDRLGTVTISLFLTFYQCDNETGDKASNDFAWFFKYVNGLMFHDLMETIHGVGYDKIKTQSDVVKLSNGELWDNICDDYDQYKREATGLVYSYNEWLRIGYKAPQKKR